LVGILGFVPLDGTKGGKTMHISWSIRKTWQGLPTVRNHRDANKIPSWQRIEESEIGNRRKTG